MEPAQAEGDLDMAETDEQDVEQSQAMEIDQEPTETTEEAAAQPEEADEPMEPAQAEGDLDMAETDERDVEQSQAMEIDQEPTETTEDAAAQPEEMAEPGESGEAEDTAATMPESPYDKPGDWYVIHSYSGYENKVKANLETRIQSMHMEERIYEVHIPMEDVVEFKGGKKVTVPKKVFPGYLLVRMTLDDDSWYTVRNTPGVTGFVAGNAQKPTPLSRREVERFLGVQKEEEKTKPRFKPEWEVGEQVRVGTGPFADFNGVIEEINVDQQKVRVLVNIFGRDTPIELGFGDIQKN
jgi:transcriptional antiterminator NusG